MFRKFPVLSPIGNKIKEIAKIITPACYLYTLGTPGIILVNNFRLFLLSLKGTMYEIDGGI